MFNKHLTREFKPIPSVSTTEWSKTKRIYSSTGRIIRVYFRLTITEKRVHPSVFCSRLGLNYPYICPKKSWPILYTKLPYNMSRDFLGKQYSTVLLEHSVFRIWLVLNSLYIQYLINTLNFFWNLDACGPSMFNQE